MAKVKALVSFTTPSFSMYLGEERCIEDKNVLDDLLHAGHVELVEPEKKKAKKGDK